MQLELGARTADMCVYNLPTSTAAGSTEEGQIAREINRSKRIRSIAENPNLQPEDAYSLGTELLVTR